jgi:hypothetical protein
LYASPDIIRVKSIRMSWVGHVARMGEICYKISVGKPETKRPKRRWEEIAQSVWRWTTGWTIGVLGFDSRRRMGIFLFTTASRPSPPSLLSNGYQGLFPWW